MLPWGASLWKRALVALFVYDVSMRFHRALPVLLAVWGAALLGVALLDWAGYGVVLQLVVLSR